jgi:hypothetical protein
VQAGQTGASDTGPGCGDAEAAVRAGDLGVILLIGAAVVIAAIVAARPW